MYGMNRFGLLPQTGKRLSLSEYFEHSQVREVTARREPLTDGEAYHSQFDGAQRTVGKGVGRSAAQSAVNDAQREWSRYLNHDFAAQGSGCIAEHAPG